MGLKKITISEIKNLNSEFSSFKNVLDVGCGEKIYKNFVKFENYLGIDVEDSGHEDSKKLPDKYFDGENIPFEDATFDLILCTEVLEHALNPEKLLTEMKRVLTPQGRILLTVPSMWGEHETPYDFRRYTSFGIKKLIKDSDLQLMKYEKEDPGTLAWAKLGSSEIQNSKSSKLVKTISKICLKLTYLLISKILKVEMKRIYLTNVAIIAKN